MEIDIGHDVPQTVFKFNPLSSYSLDAFINHYLFASHPFHLNDHMDGRSYTIDMRRVSSELYHKIKHQIVEQAPLITNGALFNQLNPEIDCKRKILQKAISDSYFCFGGIVSLSVQNRFNELMWSHYTNETGYMIEFDTNRLLNSIKYNCLNIPIFNQIFFRPVNYKDHPTSINCVECPNIRDINLYNATQKSKEWSYEKEWRLIVTSYPFLGLPENYEIEDQYTDVSKRKLYYDFNAIKRIYLGKRFWNSAYIENKHEINDNCIIYTIKPELIPFIQLLCKYNVDIYMSGCCECAEFRFGTDTFIYSKLQNKYIFDPKYYYLIRSFEKIIEIEISGNNIEVTYSGKHRTKDEDFDDPIIDIQSDFQFT